MYGDKLFACTICNNTSDVVFLGAEGAQTGAVGSNSLLHVAVGQRIALIQSLAIIVGMIDLAEGTPEHFALHGIDSSLLLLFGHRVKVIAADATDQQCDDSNHSSNGLGLLVQILVGQHQDDDGNKSDHAGNDAHVVPQPKFKFLGLGNGINAVSLLPQLGTNDYKSQIQHQEGNVLIQGGHKLQVDLAQNHQ